MGLELSLQWERAASVPAVETTFGRLATGVQVCLLKSALLSLRLHWSFATTYLGHKVPTKVILYVDCCQIVISVGG